MVLNARGVRNCKSKQYLLIVTWPYMVIKSRGRWNNFDHRNFISQVKDVRNEFYALDNICMDIYRYLLVLLLMRLQPFKIVLLTIKTQWPLTLPSED